MKLIFIRAIHNHPKLEIKVDEKHELFQNAAEIPSGYEVEIEKDVKSIKGLKPANQDIVRALLSSKSVIIVEDSPESKDAVRALKEEVEAEKKTRNIKPHKPAAV